MAQLWSWTTVAVTVPLPLLDVATSYNYIGVAIANAITTPPHTSFEMDLLNSMDLKHFSMHIFLPSAQYVRAPVCVCVRESVFLVHIECLLSQYRSFIHRYCFCCNLYCFHGYWFCCESPSFKAFFMVVISGFVQCTLYDDSCASAATADGKQLILVFSFFFVSLWKSTAEKHHQPIERVMKLRKTISDILL